MIKRIHIFGSTGSGTSSIGKSLCEQIHYKHFDADDYLWLTTEEPYTIMRSKDEYYKLMFEDLNSCDEWILSGHVSFGLPDVFLPLYDLIVFVFVPVDIRIERIKKREYERYGDRILPGNDRYELANELIEYARSYDTSDGGRSLRKHENWLKSVNCPVLRINNDSFDKSVNAILDAIKINK